jgi:hypothetical protein
MHPCLTKLWHRFYFLRRRFVCGTLLLCTTTLAVIQNILHWRLVTRASLWRRSQSASLSCRLLRLMPLSTRVEHRRGRARPKVAAKISWARAQTRVRSSGQQFKSGVRLSASVVSLAGVLSTRARSALLTFCSTPDDDDFHAMHRCSTGKTQSTG